MVQAIAWHRDAAATFQSRRFRRPCPPQLKRAGAARPVAVMGKPLIARSKGGQHAAGAGELILHEVARRLGMAEHLAADRDEFPWAGQVRCTVADMP